MKTILLALTILGIFSLLAGGYAVFQSAQNTKPSISQHVDSGNPATKDTTNTLTTKTEVLSETRNSELLEIARAFARYQDTPINAGDVVEIYVVGEEDLYIKSMVRNNGDITFPLAGVVTVTGVSLDHIADTIRSRIAHLIPDADVKVNLHTRSYTIFILGNVAQPGQYAFKRKLDVRQAIAAVGGFVKMADKENISILRRQDGTEQTLNFNYSEVEREYRLGQNIILNNADIVIVP